MQLLSIRTVAKNSMRFFCLLFWLALPLVITETLLLETDDETDLNDVGSNDEVKRVKRFSEWLKEVPNDPAGLRQDVFNLYIK